MDEETKQLLREIRDLAAREERARKHMTAAIWVFLAILLGVCGYLTVRLDGLVSSIEQAPAEVAV